VKILRVAADLYPDVVGGIGLHAHEMSKIQASMGHDVTVFSSLKDNSENKIEHTDGYKIVRHKEIANIFGNSISPEKFFSLIETYNDYDIVHAHSHLFFSTNIASLVRKFNKKTPLVITSHGLIPVSGPEIMYRMFLPTVAHWTFKNCDAVLCYTEEQKKKLSRVTKTELNKIHVVPNGINTNMFSPYKADHDDFRILWVGRMVERKGIQELLKAFKLLHSDFKETKLLLVGEGPLREWVIDFIYKNSLEDSVELKSFVKYEDMPKIYNSCDIFVLPSHHEGVPKSVLEAMACGLPIVMTEMEHLTDLLDGAGLTHKLGKVEEIRDRIQYLIENNDRLKRMGKKGHKKIEKQHSWRDTVKKTKDVYQNLI